MTIDKKSLNFDKKKIKTTIKNFEKNNNTKIKDVNQKQLALILHNELVNRCDRIEDKIEKHIEWGQKEDSKLHKAIADHDILFQEIIGKLPEKGFCESVTNALKLDKKTTLADQVEFLWHDRRWLKAIFWALIAVSSGLVINIIIQVVI